MSMIHTLLIANRGEIASRIIKTCRIMGIRSVAVYSDADADALYVQQADSAFRIGGNTPAESYLDQDKLIAAAKATRADAIHPGFGFLSENASFAQRCIDEGLNFVGPSPQSIAAMGSKSAAKALLKDSPVPLIPGYQGEDQSLATLVKAAHEIGLPVLVKASAGGGGKGMRIVNDASELESAITAAASEAKAAFGDAQLLIEKYFDRARHIEVQVFGDKQGKVVHLFERECSLQRRFQKVFEEAPSPTLSPEQRDAICSAAVAAAQAVQYYNAGTVEFIYSDGQFYFLEMNTRLQVEHPVTEQITGLDLVRLQLEVAQGLPIPFEQADLRINGHAIEARLYAEDAMEQFKPSAGHIEYWQTATQEGLRYDTGIGSGSDVHSFYDPMIAKVIAYGQNRTEAISRLRKGLSDTAVLGIQTNRAFLLSMLNLPAVIDNQVDTKFIEREQASWSAALALDTRWLHQYAIAATLYRWMAREKAREQLHFLPSGWRNLPYQAQLQGFMLGDTLVEVRYKNLHDKHFTCSIDGTDFKVQILDVQDNSISLEIDAQRLSFILAASQNTIHVQNSQYMALSLQERERFPEPLSVKVPGLCLAPMPGELIRVLVQAGDSVKAGDPLLVISSMKMENTLYADLDGRVEELFVHAGQFVKPDMELLRIG